MAVIRLVILIILSAMLLGCSDMLVTSSDLDNNLEDFEIAWEVIDSVYPYFEFKQIDWDSIYTVYRPRAEQTEGDDIYTLLIDMLTELKDQHISIETDGGESLSTYISPRTERDRYSYNPLVIRNYFDRELRLACDGKIEYEILSGNIGYIYISTFQPDDLMIDFPSVIHYLRNTDGLIIDVRHNTGGSSANSNQVVSRFIDSPFQLMDVFYNGEIVMLSPIQPVGPQYVNPIVVLINGVSVSEAERFAEMMKQIQTVTVVGDTTCGASCGGVRSFQLPSGKRFYTGVYDFRRYDGLPWEWLGIPPDVYVAQTEEDINRGIDHQLEYAIQLLD